ncbi:MAG: class I cytochrome c [Deltaproteobacteria bacterium CSP1-8]|nr:MAG: class I cytochrome c [Deltaproteobacteria bacterium CSP1-8]
MHDRKSSRIAACTFGALCVLCAALLFGWGCGKKESGPTERTIAKSEPSAHKPHLNSDLIQGRKVFEQKHCSQCHSIFERERKIGPKLQSSRFYGSFLDVFSTLWNHAPAMAVYMRKEVLDRPQFSTAELNQLVSFLYMLPYLGESGNPRKGEALLEGKACFRCHSLARKGKKNGVPLDALAVYQSQVVLLQRMWNHGPEMISQMVTAGTAIPTFSGNDMTDIFAALTESAPEKSRKVFLGVGNVENGLKVFTDKGCNQCHAIFGTGGKDAPDLGISVSQANITTLITRLWNHAGQMREKFQQKKLQWPHFTETEMNDLMVFLYSLNYEDKPGDPAKGEQVFAQKKCVDCHFKTDVGKQKIVRDIKTADALLFATQMWNHIPAMEAAMVTQAVPWPEMTGQQLRDVLAFLHSQ